MTTELDPTHTQLVTQLVELNAQISDLTEQAETIKAKLRANLDTGTHTINGRPAVTITPTRRFSTTRAQTVLPTELLTLCQIHVIDAKRAREVLPPALYESCQEITGKPQVRLA
jgi:hypothetical protein